jgi:hypothetical protein
MLAFVLSMWSFKSFPLALGGLPCKRSLTPLPRLPLGYVTAFPHSSCSRTVVTRKNCGGHDLLWLVVGMFSCEKQSLGVPTVACLACHTSTNTNAARHHSWYYD